MSGLDKDLHIVVLMGGWSAERPVSLMSGNGVADALEERGFTNVTAVDMDRNVAAVLAGLRPDVVFNALHGTPGEDGTVQGMLDLMQIPYTHSGLETSVDRDRQGTDQDGAGPRRRAHAQGQDGRQQGALRRRPDGAALCAEAGQRGQLGRGRDRHRRQQLRPPDQRQGRRAVACISTACSPSRSSAGAS